MKKIIIVLIVILILGAGWYFLKMNSDTFSSPQEEEQINAGDPEAVANALGNGRNSTALRVNMLDRLLTFATNGEIDAAFMIENEGNIISSLSGEVELKIKALKAVPRIYQLVSIKSPSDSLFDKVEPLYMGDSDEVAYQALGALIGPMFYLDGERVKADLIQFASDVSQADSRPKTMLATLNSLRANKVSNANVDKTRIEICSSEVLKSNKELAGMLYNVCK